MSCWVIERLGSLAVLLTFVTQAHLPAVLLQDTNAQVIRALTAALGVSARRDLDMNSLCVPRKAKEVKGPGCHACSLYQLL